MSKYTPRKYQLIGRDFLKARRFAMLGDAPGVGKTGQAIIAMDSRWRTLIVCPASVKYQWRQMLMDWRGTPSIVITSSHQHIPQDVVVIINYDLIIREPILKQLLKRRFDLIIYDESHKLKNLNAKRTKVALGKSFLRPRTTRIWFLTGTPIKNRTIDFFPILKSCAPEIIEPYTSLHKFAYKFCGAYKGKFGIDMSGASNTEQLAQRLQMFMLRREKRDVLKELPPRVLSVVDLECSPAVKNIIREEELRTMEQAGEDDPAFFKLGEIVRIRKALAKHKVPVSVEYINDLLEEEDKIVVFYHHKEVLHALQREFTGTPNVYIDGSVPSHKRKGIVEKFARGKDIRLFFGQMEASGEGIDGLQTSCNTCVFVEPSWAHTDTEQCIGRLERDGQRNDINVHILVIKDSIESRMMEVVAQKLRVDKQLYGQQKENEMPKRKSTEAVPTARSREDILEDCLVVLTQVLERLTTPDTVLDPGAPLPSSTAAPEQVTVPQGDDDVEVTEDAIRARAGDVSQIKPDGTGKAKCVEIINRIGGGKIADLKTNKMRAACLKELDKEYDRLALAAQEEEM